MFAYCKNGVQITATGASRTAFEVKEASPRKLEVKHGENKFVVNTDAFGAISITNSGPAFGNFDKHADGKYNIGIGPANYLVVEPEPQWTCASCTFINKQTSMACDMCATTRETTAATTKEEEAWSCPQCTFTNTNGTNCTICDTAKA